MPFNGSGVFAIVNTFVPGTTIFSSAVNANFTDIASGLSTAVLKNGTQTITANIAMSGFGFTGVGQIASQATITVASSATTDILAQLSLLIAISGAATITSFGADAASRRNQIKFVRATGAFTITYNATSMITPTAADIVCASGDTFVVISDASSNARIYAFQRASGYALISYPGFRNIARRNGGLEVWQRGAGGAASFAVTASTTAYTADGWYLSASANQATTVAQTVGIGLGSQFAAIVGRNNGQTGTAVMVFGFPLDSDELWPMLGQFVRLSFTAKAGANWSPASGNLVYRLNVGTGTPVKFTAGYTGATVPVNATAALLTSSVRFQASSTAVIPTTTRQAEITFTWTPVGTAGADDTFTIDDVQLEIVPDASQGSSPFERLNFEEALVLCKRHYEKTFLYSSAPAQAGGLPAMLAWLSGVTAGSNTLVQWRYREAKRVAPSIITFSPEAANAQIENITLGTACTSTGVVVSATEAQIAATTPASTTAIQTMGVHVTADAGI